MLSFFKPILALLLFVSFACPSFATVTAEADAAYHRSDFVGAAALYEEALQERPDAETYYNLGNANYRMKKYAAAAVAYLRCLRLDPSHEDAAYNLELLRTRLTDRFTPPGEMFFVTLFRDTVRAQSHAAWGLVAFVALVVMLLAWCAFRLAPQVWQRKVAFFLAAVSFFLVCLFHLFAFLQYRNFHEEQLVVVAGTASLRATPSPTGKLVRELHEGTTLRVVGTAPAGRLQVELPDGSEGWVQGSEVINVR